MLKCLNCKSENLLKRGFRYNNLGKKQKYFCQDCKKWFVEDEGFNRMRYDSKIIVLAIHMHNEGLSLFQVKNILWQHHSVSVARSTIRYWVEKYSAFLKYHKFNSANIKGKTTFR